MSHGCEKGYFASNDLQQMKGYFNSHSSWRDFYNATVVVPIKPCREDAAKTLMGFLCVDSKHGIFSEDVVAATLVLVAEILYRYIRSFPEIEEREAA
jgi:hypothetical protein